MDIHSISTTISQNVVLGTLRTLTRNTTVCYYPAPELFILAPGALYPLTGGFGGVEVASGLGFRASIAGEGEPAADFLPLGLFAPY